MGDSIQFDHQLSPAALKLIAAVEARKARAAQTPNVASQTTPSNSPKNAEAPICSMIPTKRKPAPNPKSAPTPAQLERLRLIKEAGMRVRAKLEAAEK